MNDGCTPPEKRRKTYEGLARSLQRDDDGGTLPGGAIDGDFAAGAFDHAFRDRQPQAGAGNLAALIAA